MDLYTQIRKRRLQTLPLLLDERRLGPARAAHPRIDFVFDPVMIGRAKQQLAHKHYLRRRLSPVRSSPASASASSRRNGSTSVTKPIDCSGWCSMARSTAVGSISTQTVFTVGASMAATARDCCTVPSRKTWV